MADGEVHLLGNLALGTALVVGAHAIGLPLEPVLVGAAFGTIITPDYDLEGKTVTEDVLRSIPLFGFMWQWSWYGYAMLFKHRGLSHNVFLGTLGRVGWLGLLTFFWGAVLILLIEFMGWGRLHLFTACRIGAGPAAALLAQTCCILLDSAYINVNHRSLVRPIALDNSTTCQVSSGASPAGRSSTPLRL
jgi:uncharacterized metal-binding protein